MRGRSETAAQAPTMMIHHVREIQLRLLAVVGVLIAGMVVGYLYYEPLFEFIKAPLSGPLHYTSPAGSFTFIIKICMMIGIIVTLPVAIYNAIMFVQPALSKRLSRARVYLTTFASLLLATGGAAFGFFVIIPLALRFFYKFQVDGLVALISADEYLRFVVGVIITFVIIFQLPLLISLIDHIKPLPPRKLLKLEKYIIVGSVFIGVVVPFALDPTVQLLIASPIIVLYNLSIVIVVMQHGVRARRMKRAEARARKRAPQVAEPAAVQAPAPVVATAPVAPAPTISAPEAPKRRPVRSMDGVHKPATRVSQSKRPLGVRTSGMISDVRPTPRPAARLTPPPRPSGTMQRQSAE
ncbi:MAG TPA: twin-arginine translocase subunit TatC [Candidatus Saccharimonadales bacterium]|nr:twin-arginine translocase subunit TatC [Candidatus Saccharimonadales bacterium]